VSTYSGTLINDLLKMNGIEMTEDYSIEQIVELLTAEAEPLPNCAGCEAPAGLTYCKHCREWFCINGCLEKHACCQPDGPNNSDPLRG
jgi:hypothetical protein